MGAWSLMCSPAPYGSRPPGSFPHMETVVRPRLPVALTALLTMRHGPRDPSIRVRRDEVWRAVHTPHGAATACYARRGDEFVVTAWGPGAEWCIETAPDTLGARDCWDGWEPGRNRIVADLDRRFEDMRMIATHAVMEAVIPTVLEQKVTSEEAHESWRKIVWRWGE